MIELTLLSLLWHLAASLGLAFALTAVAMLGVLAIAMACFRGAMSGMETTNLPRMWARKGRR